MSKRVYLFVGFGLLLFAGLTSMSLFEFEVERTVTAETVTGSLQRSVFVISFLIYLFHLMRSPSSLLAAFSLMGPLLIAFTIWAILSSTWSAVPLDSLYRSFQISVAIFLIYGYLSALDDPLLSFRVLYTVCIIIIIINIASILLVPDLAIQKFIHTGAWKGMHNHKNVAGRVGGACTVVTFAASFLLPKGRTWKWFLPAAAAIFLYQTQSKTALAATAGAIAAWLFCYLTMGLSSLSARLMALLVAVSAVALLVVTAVLLGWVDQAMSDGTIDFTVSQRDILWAFLAQLILTSPVVGHGYGGVWDTDTGPVQEGAYGWFLFAHQGHNGYLDTAVAVGLPMTLCLIAVVVRSLFAPFRWTSRHRAIAAALFSLTAYTLIVNMAESGFFDRWRDISMVLIFCLGSIGLVRWQAAGRDFAPSTIHRRLSAPREAPASYLVRINQ